jgi:hypothetical protein
LRRFDVEEIQVLLHQEATKITNIRNIFLLVPDES